VKIGAALVGACEDMDKAHHQFALIQDQTFNPSLWAPSGNGAFTLKPGVRPSDAVKDIFNNPGLYQFECATALVIVHYKAMLDLLGPKDFDTVCAKLTMGPWVYESTLAANWTVSGQEADATAERQAELRAGDYTYFKNRDVSDAGLAAGWQGENVISLGGGKFYGHPFGISTQEHIVDYLNLNRKAGSTITAAMLDLQARLRSELLRLDLTPGE
jgi:protein-glutamine gamma-glutamyltransferase